MAYACAARYAETYVVTLSVDRVLFRDAIHVGDLVSFSARVNYTGRTSMEVGIRVDTENIRSGTRRHTNSSYFTMVAVDEDGKPVAVHPLTPTTETGRRRYDEAQARRAALRLGIRQVTIRRQTAAFAQVGLVWRMVQMG